MSTRPLDRFLNGIEKAGNKLPDPAILFVIALVLVWILSALLSRIAFAEIDPRNGQPIKVLNLLSGTAMAGWLAGMVNTFVTFPPLGVVLVALLGVGVAESVGFLNAGLKWLLNLTPKALPLQVGEDFVPDWVVSGAHFAAWAVVSGALLYFAGVF